MSEDIVARKRRKFDPGRRLWDTEPAELKGLVEGWWVALNKHSELVRDLGKARKYLKALPDPGDERGRGQIASWLRKRYPHIARYSPALDEDGVYAVLAVAALPGVSWGEAIKSLLMYFDMDLHPVRAQGRMARRSSPNQYDEAIPIWGDVWHSEGPHFLVHDRELPTITLVICPGATCGDVEDALKRALKDLDPPLPERERGQRADAGRPRLLVDLYCAWCQWIRDTGSSPEQPDWAEFGVYIDEYDLYPAGWGESREGSIATRTLQDRTKEAIEWLAPVYGTPDHP